MDAALAELAATTTAIIAVRDLPAALAELRILEEKHATAVNELHAAEAAATAAADRESEAYSVLDAHEIKLDDTYDFLPTYHTCDPASVLKGLIAEQQQAISDIRAATQAFVQAAIPTVDQKTTLSTPGENKDALTPGENKNASTEAQTVNGGIMTQGAIIVRNGGDVILAIPTKYIDELNWSASIINIDSGYNKVDLRKISVERLCGMIGLLSDYHRSGIGCSSLDWVIEAPLTIMNLVHQSRNRYYTEMPSDYTGVFSYRMELPAGLDDTGRMDFFLRGVSGHHIMLKKFKHGYLGIYNHQCKVLIPSQRDPSDLIVPAWIPPTFDIRM